MSISKLALIKDILNITGTDHDRRIAALIPGAEAAAFKYTRNYFHISGMSIQSDEITFATARTITDGTGNFIGYYWEPSETVGPVVFQAGMYIHIEDSVLNDGHFLIDTVSSNVITLDSNEELFAEAAGALVRISAMKVDEGFKLAIAQLINSQLNKKSGVKSEKFDDYSVTFESEQESIKNLFSPYKKITVR